MVLIDVYGPGTVALGVLISFYFVFILLLTYFRFRSVLPNLHISEFWKNRRSATSDLAPTVYIERCRGGGGGKAGKCKKKKLYCTRGV
jgi:hypothetical protein